MLYRLYIYNSTAASASALTIDACNRAVSLGSLRDWVGNGAARSLADFNVQEVAARIHALVGEKCRAYVKTPPCPKGGAEYLCVATSYAQAAAVLPYLHCVTAEYDLVLYDAETERTFFRELVNRTLIQAKLRIADYTNAILREMRPIYRIRKIGLFETELDYDHAYAVTIKKDLKKSFSARCEDFYRCLNDRLLDGEELNTDNECFTIVGRGYTISFCLEGYKRHPHQMGYYAQGLPKAKLIKRMGCEEGFRWLKEQESEHIDAVLERMNFRELKQAYPNPADRFVASVNIQKWESRNASGIRYCGIGFYGAEMLFHVIPSDDFPDAQEISMLAVCEDNAEPILSVVSQFYPHIYRRYYEENHLPPEMWIDIVEEAKKRKAACVGLRNFRDARLLDVFIRWSEAQLKLYHGGGDSRMFNIQGP